MAVNVKLLKKVRKLIADEPRRLDMGAWGHKLGPQAAQAGNAPPCGTVACLAGWTMFATREGLLKKLPANQGLDTFLWNDLNEDVATEAAKALGLPEIDCPFYRTTWGVNEVLAWIDRQIDAAT